MILFESNVVRAVFSYFKGRIEPALIQKSSEGYSVNHACVGSVWLVL